MSNENRELVGLPGIRVDIAPDAGWDTTVEPDVDTVRHDNREQGLGLEEVGGVMAATQFYSGSLEGYKRWSGPMPDDIAFDMTRDDVRRHLGPVEASGEPSVGILGPSSAWDRFERPDHFLHVQYGGPGGTVDLVTTMIPDCVPGRAGPPTTG